jgi:hypothetical protein
MRRAIGWIGTAALAASLAACGVAKAPSIGYGQGSAAPPADLPLGRAVASLSSMSGFTRNAIVTLNYFRPRSVRLTGAGVVVDFDDGSWSCRFADTPYPPVEDRFLANPPTTMALNCDRGMLYHWDSRAANLERAVAWRTMASLARRLPPEHEPSFVAAVAPFQAGQLGPEVPESVRARKVAAEVAVRERNLWRAVEEFEAGLAIAPWWPQGIYNVALVYAELGIYPRAIGYMRRYLTLLPQAPNARQAQDKIYEWQAKGG